MATVGIFRVEFFPALKSPEWLCEIENVARSSVRKSVGWKWVKYQFLANYPFKGADIKYPLSLLFSYTSRPAYIIHTRQAAVRKGKKKKKILNSYLVGNFYVWPLIQEVKFTPVGPPRGAPSVGVKGPG